MTLSVLSLLMMMLCACEQPDDGGGKGTSQGTVTVAPESVSVSSSATEVVLTVTADCDWGVTADDKTWVSVSPSGGITGVTDVKVKIAENTTGEVRTTDVVVRYGTSRLSVPVRQNYKVEAVTVSDPAFMAALLNCLDEDGDGILSTKEIEGVTDLDLSDAGIKDMSELGTLFPGLESLDCSGNDLKDLDITLLVSLKVLDASGNDGLTLYVWTGFNKPEGYTLPSDVVIVEPEIPTPAGYELVWQEEFNESATGLPDTKKWWYETGDGGWGNNELQDYVSGTYKGQKIAEVSGGRLTITAQEIDGKVRSVRMNTSKSWTYGYFEARLKLPKGKGTWPAFWMMPKNFTTWPGDGEIDIMEHVGYHQDYVSSSIHCLAYYHSIGTQKTREIHLKGATDEFHVYALEWTPEYIKSYVDGEQLFYYKPEDHGARNYDTWPFDNPFYLKLNLAWGGNWGGAMGIDESCLPATYEIDYVRVFQKP